MNLALLVSNAFWIPVCLMALALIYWDIAHPKRERRVRDVKARRFVIAGVLAVTLSAAAIFAAEIQPEWCESVCPFVGPITWWIIGCYVCLVSALLSGGSTRKQPVGRASQGANMGNEPVPQ